MFQLRRGYEVDVSVSFVDDMNDPAQVEGDPLWSVSDSQALQLVDGVDASSKVLQAIGPVGAQAVLSVEADADLGAGVVPVIATEDINIVSGQATSASFGFGEPRLMGE